MSKKLYRLQENDISPKYRTTGTGGTYQKDRYSFYIPKNSIIMQVYRYTAYGGEAVKYTG